MIHDFEYYAPKTLKEALTLLEKYKDDGKIICGGRVIPDFDETRACISKVHG